MEDIPIKLEALTSKLNIPECNLLLIGDGSGNTADKPCGFACIAYDFQSKQYVLHEGGFNHGTNNFSELIPYIHALWWDHKYFLKDELYEERKVEIVSDSELIVKQGNKTYLRTSNRALWAAIDEFVWMDYTIHWNHVLRNTNEFNTLCDSLAKENRKKFLLTSEKTGL
jgi:ribonuclease HI